MGGPQKADERNKVASIIYVTRVEGVKKSENFADVIYGSPPKGVHMRQTQIRAPHFTAIKSRTLAGKNKLTPPRGIKMGKGTED